MPLRARGQAKETSQKHAFGFEPVLYVPLQKKHFDTVEINIITDTGLPVPFLPGKSFVVLEFRRAVHPYLTRIRLRACNLRFL